VKRYWFLSGFCCWKFKQICKNWVWNIKSVELSNVFTLGPMNGTGYTSRSEPAASTCAPCIMDDVCMDRTNIIFISYSNQAGHWCTKSSIHMYLSVPTSNHQLLLPAYMVTLCSTYLWCTVPLTIPLTYGVLTSVGRFLTSKKNLKVVVLVPSYSNS